MERGRHLPKRIAMAAVAFLVVAGIATVAVNWTVLWPPESTVSAAHALAIEATGANPPPREVIDAFDSLMKRLAAKCPKDQPRDIRTVITVTRNMLEQDHRVRLTLLQVAAAIDSVSSREAARFGYTECLRWASLVLADAGRGRSPEPAPRRRQ